MSIIVYGPQGCGKSSAGEALRKHFKLARVIDGAANPYPAERDIPRFKAGAVLYLTNMQPPEHLANSERRIMSFDAATADMKRRSQSVNVEVSGCLRAPMPEDAPRTAAGSPLDRPVGPVAGA